MKCPICGKAKLVRDTRDVTYTYKGESTVLPDVTGDFCPACDEYVLSDAESRRTMDLLLALLPGCSWPTRRAWPPGRH